MQVRDSQYTARESRRAPCSTRQTQHTPVVALASKASAVAEYLLQLAFAACSFPLRIITNNAPHPKPSPDVLFPGSLELLL